MSVNFVVSGSIPWAGNKKELVVYKQRITSVSDQRFKNADPTFLQSTDPDPIFWKIRIQPNGKYRSGSDLLENVIRIRPLRKLDLDPIFWKIRLDPTLWKIRSRCDLLENTDPTYWKI